jgi:hypothetical protein
VWAPYFFFVAFFLAAFFFAAIVSPPSLTPRVPRWLVIRTLLEAAEACQE